MDPVRGHALLSTGPSTLLERYIGRPGKLPGEAKAPGIDRAPSRSNLAYANEKRQWKLYEKLFYQLLDRVRMVALGRKKFRFKNKLFSLDATLIELCVSRFGWSLSNLIAMLRYNLFTYRNLWEWIDSPYEVPPLVPLGEQLTLEFV